MGWFFNKKNKENQDHATQFSQNENQNNNAYSSKSSSSFYSKKRKCQNDPDDNQYIICKTVIKDNNGTREQEERLPKNGGGGSFQQNSSFSFSSSSHPFSSEQQKVFDKFPSFFIQPSFFDFHNSTPSRIDQNHAGNDEVENHSYFKTFSQAKTCHSDPEDKQYLICKSQVNDGKQTKQVEERIKISDQFHIPSFGKQFNSFGSSIDNQIHDFMRQINSGFNFMMPFLGPMMGFANAMNGLNPQNIQKNLFPHQNKEHYGSGSPQQNNYEDHNYFNSNNSKKDTTVYDL